jgi:hypothetical protein
MPGSSGLPFSAARRPKAGDGQGETQLRTAFLLRPAVAVLWRPDVAVQH